MVVAAALFGTTGTLAAAIGGALSPQVIGAWRAVLGGIGMVAWAAIGGHRLVVHGRDLGWALLGGIAVAGYQLAFFEAVVRTGVATGTLVTIASGPVVAAVLDRIVHGIRPRPIWYVGVALAAGGVALLGGGVDRFDMIGVGLAIVASAAFPIYGATAQHLMRDRTPVSAMTSVFAVGGLLLAPLAVSSAPEVFAAPASWTPLAALGIGTLTVAYLLWGHGLSRTTLATVVAVTLIEPVVATALAVLVLGEASNALAVVGAGLVIGGVAISTRSPARNETAEPFGPIPTG